MDDAEYRRVSVEFERQRLELEKKKFDREDNFFNRNFGAIISSTVAVLGLFLGVVQFLVSERGEEASKEVASQAAAVSSVLGRAQACFSQAERYTRFGTQDNDRAQGDAYFQKGRELAKCTRLVNGDEIWECVAAADNKKGQDSVHC